MSRIEMKLESCFENGNYYEAHQIYRTLYNRMCNQEKWQELQDMLYNGALRLLSGEVALLSWCKQGEIDIASLLLQSISTLSPCSVRLVTSSGEWNCVSWSKACSGFPVTGYSLLNSES